MRIPGPRVRVIAALAALFTALVLVMATGCGATDDAAPGPAAPTVITSTTEIAGAGVLGNQRRPDESCAAEPAPVDPGPPVRDVHHTAGHSAVPADPQRIVVLAGDQLDALCALGLQSRIVAAALPDGADEQPSYLGTVIHELPAAGTRSDPDLAAVRAAEPDLILGSQALTPTDYPELSEIAPTVFTGPAGADWQANLRTVGAATGRFDATTALIGGFDEAARQTGIANDAAHFQASVVQFTDNTVRVYGAANFPATVLAEVGLDRPPAQRFTDKPYLELGATGGELDDADAFDAAEGDIVYVSFASPAARDRAATVFESDAWRALSANKDNRVFAVNNEVWQTGQGVVAARGILDDLQWVNAPIN